MDGRIFESNIMGIGQKRDFYKLKYLSSHDIAFVRRLVVDVSPKHLQDLHENLIYQFALVFRLREWATLKGINDRAVDIIFDQAIHNLEENLHTGIEQTAIKYIDAILREDIEFYNTDEGCRDFSYFLCTQYMRTDNAKQRVLEAVDSIEGIDFETIWNVLSHIFATNMGWVLFAERRLYKMILMKNETEKEFLTGDQPVLNTHAKPGVSNILPEKLELYYPVSPRIAILIREAEEYKDVQQQLVTESDVLNYNNLVVRNSRRQVYATSVDVLQEYNSEEF